MGPPHGAAASAWLAGWRPGLCILETGHGASRGCPAPWQGHWRATRLTALPSPCRAKSSMVKRFLQALTRDVHILDNQTADIVRHTILGSMCTRSCGSTLWAAISMARPGRGARRRCPRPSRPPAPACPAGGPSAAGSAGSPCGPGSARATAEHPPLPTRSSPLPAKPTWHNSCTFTCRLPMCSGRQA